MAGKGKNKTRKDALRQVAALPLRRGASGVEVCLVTTRETRRWTVPKGWPMKGLTDSVAATIEAKEEAGLICTPADRPIGAYQYWKRRRAHFDHVEVAVYTVWTTGALDHWKEKDQRMVAWASIEDAACVVDDPGLAAILMHVSAMTDHQLDKM